MRRIDLKTVIYFLFAFFFFNHNPKNILDLISAYIYIMLYTYMKE